jgi:hypothetical protein
VRLSGGYPVQGRMLLNGRLLEVTNGCFVDAQREKPRLGVGQLQRNPTGGFGSRPAARNF